MLLRGLGSAVADVAGAAEKALLDCQWGVVLEPWHLHACGYI
jgi:hypothetical protein